MKTITSKLAAVIIPFIVLAIVVTASNGLAHKVERAQAAAMISNQPAPEMFSNSIGAVMDNLITASGR